MQQPASPVQYTFMHHQGHLLVPAQGTLLQPRQPYPPTHPRHLFPLTPPPPGTHPFPCPHLPPPSPSSSPPRRAYRKQVYYTDASDDLMELNAFAFITQKAANSWLAMRLDVLGLFVICLAGVLCIQGSISPAMAGLCLLYALDTTRYLKFGTQMASQTESYFNSVERIVQVGQGGRAGLAPAVASGCGSACCGPISCGPWLLPAHGCCLVLHTGQGAA
jgi:hypothetical protein